MSNINSYTENLRELTSTVRDTMSMMNALGNAMYGNSETANVDGSINIVSTQNIINRINRVEDTVAKFTQGKGLVETDDGTYRKIKVDTVSKPPATIYDLGPITTFNINPNWFFESLQYPRCIVNIDLKDKIDDDSDRVYVSRIIVDTDQIRLTDEIKANILASRDEYGQIIEYLENNGILYKEDADEVSLPLTYEKYKGEFQVIGTSIIRNMSTQVNENWFYLNTINYSTVNKDGQILESGNTLTKGDMLRFGNSLYKVKDINQSEKRITLEYSIGYETVGLYDVLEFYNQPFAEKVISVGISANEIDIVYVKGVNENYNLMSREWSNPVIFETNRLIYENDTTKTFDSFYADNVADFGRMMISQAKEGQISNYDGIVPNAPVLNADDIRVVQINTQLNVTLDSEKYTQLTSEIASTKSNINSVRTAIMANKDRLTKESDSNVRESLQNTINSNTDKMNSLTTQLSSLVEDLNTMLVEAGAIGYSPKYHARGFFSIPEPRYVVDDGSTKAGKQSVIGFEIMYRYLHTDETGTPLNSFDYTDPNNSVIITNTFSDWNMVKSPVLEKIYDPDTDTYYWSKEKIDGTDIAINSIDIPIRSGEKVEVKVRSISEAGYPYNPMKSEWSNSVIISFPDNLSSSDSVTKVLDLVKSDMTAVVLQETLSSAGVYSHMSDANSQYKHDAKNIEYVETISDASTGTTVTSTMSVDDKIRGMMGMIQVLAGKLGIIFNADGTISEDAGIADQTPSVEYEWEDASTNIKSKMRLGGIAHLDSSIKAATVNTIAEVTQDFNEFSKKKLEALRQNGNNSVSGPGN